MPARLVPVDRDTPLLLPPNLRDWVAEDDLVHFVIHAVERCDLAAAHVNQRGSGNAQYPPHMMLALLIYGYAHGIFSSRALERATYNLVPMRLICADLHPDHDTIAAFRRQNGPLLETCFVEVLRLAQKLGAFTQLGILSVDGTKLAARASRRHNRKLSELEAEIAQLKGTVQELFHAAESADAAAPAADRLPRELQDPNTLLARLEAARDELQARHQAARTPAKAAKDEPPDEPPHDPDEPGPPSCHTRGEPRPQPEPKLSEDEDRRTINLQEPTSRLMRDAHGRRLQGYNAQFAVEAGADTRSQLIVGVHLSPEANDRRILGEVLAGLPALCGTPTHVVVDTGYDNATLLAAQERTYPGLTTLCPPQSKQPPRTDYRVSKPEQGRRDFNLTMRARLAEPAQQARYRRRSASVEPVIGVLKNVLGFTRFRLFGQAKAQLELTLLATAYNLRRLAQQYRASALPA